jgi:hypothetical protein
VSILTNYREQFGREIGKTFKDSTPWWTELPSSHEGKTSNVVINLFNDTDFSHFGCYGSNIDTDTLSSVTDSYEALFSIHRQYPQC